MFGQCSLHVGIVLHFRMCQHLIADQSFITQWSMKNSGSTNQLRKRQVCNTICAFCVGMPRLTENMKKHNFEQSRNIMNYLFMELHFTSCGIHVLHIVFTTSMGSTSHLNKTIVPGVGPVVRYTLEETRESDLRNTFSGYGPMFKKVTDPDLHSEWRVSSANSWIRQVLLSIPRIHAHAHPKPNDIIVHVNNLHVCTCYMSLRLDVVFGEVEFTSHWRWNGSLFPHVTTVVPLLGFWAVIFWWQFFTKDVYKRSSKHMQRERECSCAFPTFQPQLCVEVETAL